MTTLPKWTPKVYVSSHPKGTLGASQVPELFESCRFGSYYDLWKQFIGISEAPIIDNLS